MTPRTRYPKTPEQSVLDALSRALDARLVESVEEVAPGIYHVTSQRAGGEPHVVIRHSDGDAPENYRCDCPAGEHGAPTCAHWAAVALNRLLKRAIWKVEA